MENESIDTYSEQKKAIQATIKSAAKKSDSSILKKVAKNKEDEPKIRKLMEILHMLWHETCEQIESGEMEVNKAIDDFAKAVKAIN